LAADIPEGVCRSTDRGSVDRVVPAICRRHDRNAVPPVARSALVDLVLELLGSAEPATDYASLERMLTTDDALRPVTVRPRLSTPDSEAMGPVVDALLVALASGGVGVALVEAIGGWLPTRRPDVRVRVTRGDTEIELDLKRVRDPRTVVDLLREIEGGQEL
jgi:hypothetical protein